MSAEKRRVYLDHAATTSVDPRVKEAMEPYWTDWFGNAGSFNSVGLKAARALDAARATVASCLNCIPEEVIFTGSGTESINLAIQGVARANKKKGKHIIATKTEHHAVLETCEYLEKHECFEVTFLQPDRYGMVHPEDLEKAIRPDTILVSIIFANNEIGTINPIKELAAVAKKHRVLFHTDACQAGGAVALNVKELGVDLLSLNGSKMYCPKGVGCLYARRGVLIHPILHGGGQEHRLRSGTENIPLIVGFAKGMQLAQEERESENARLVKLRDRLIKGVLERVPKSVLNGHPVRRLPNNANISFLDIEGEAVLLLLDEQGIYASSGSACTSKTLDPSHVIMAIGVPYELAHGSIRFTLGKQTTEKDIDYVLEKIPPIVEKLRSWSPVNLKLEDVLPQELFGQAVSPKEVVK